MTAINLVGYRLKFDGNGVVTECTPPGAQPPAPPALPFDVLGQRDPRWHDVLLGNSRVSRIGPYGCWVTCQAMLLNTTPDVANTLIRKHGGFQAEPRGGNWNWQGITTATEAASRADPRHNVVRYKGISDKKVPGQPRSVEWFDQLQEWLLTSKQPAVLDVDMDIKRTGQQQHFVLALPAPWSTENDIKIIDPWDIDGSDATKPIKYGRLQSLTPDYGADLASAVWRYILYEVT
jgi:hypothetical protein